MDCSMMGGGHAAMMWGMWAVGALVLALLLLAVAALVKYVFFTPRQLQAH